MLDKLPNSFITGIAANVLATTIGIFLFGLYYASFKATSYTVYLDSVFALPDNTIKILGVSQLLSIPLFYAFINRNKDKSAKGIIMMFLILAIATAVIKLS